MTFGCPAVIWALSSSVATMSPSLKTLLLSLSCPMVQQTEREADGKALLITRSEHRREILQWACIKAREGLDRHTHSHEQKNQEDENVPPIRKLPSDVPMDSDSLATSLRSLGIPSSGEFARGEVGEKIQTSLWTLLLHLVEMSSSSSSDKDTSSSSFLDEVLSDAAFQYCGEGGGDRKTLLPRDLEKEVRITAKKMAAPTQERLQLILQSAKETLKETTVEVEDGGRDGSKGTDGVSDILENIDRFSLDYEASYARWIRDLEGRGQQQPHSLGGKTLDDIGHGLERLCQHRSAQSRLLSELHSIEALEEIQT